MIRRIWKAQTQQDTQLQHGGITLLAGLMGALLFGALGGYIGAQVAAAFYFWRENLTKGSGWGYWKRRTELAIDVLAVHRWDARRDWMIPQTVASSFLAAWVILAFGWWVVLALPLALGAFVWFDRHPHPGLVVEGLR